MLDVYCVERLLKTLAFFGGVRQWGIFGGFLAEHCYFFELYTI